MTESQSESSYDWERIQLIPEAIPDFNFDEVSLTVSSLGQSWPSPFFVSSMTGGHADSVAINSKLAEACSQRGWLLGVGSQRRELTDGKAGSEWETIRKRFPNIKIASNIGVAQLIQEKPEAIQKLIDSTQAVALFIHVNALQECLQIEGTPQFRGSWKAIENVKQKLNVPIIVKEVGVGLSASTCRRLADLGIQAVDVSGRGGTHWGRIEGLRASDRSSQKIAAEVFADWGQSTPKILYELSKMSIGSTEIWASGGIRNGLQAVQCLAMGASRVGLARPILQKCVDGVDAVVGLMDQLEYELKIGLFCLGAKNVAELKQRKVWVWQTE